MLKPSADRERGFALLSAIIGLGILLVLVSSLVAISQIGLARSNSDLDRSQADAFSDAVLLRAILALESDSLDARPRVDGVDSTINVLDATVNVKIEDEFGKIDLNAASPLLLSRLFQTAGLDAVKSDEMAEEVEKWRERNTSAHGAGQFDGQLPNRRIFRLVNELMLVPGMDQKTFAAIEPALTVYSGQDHIDQAVAPYQALMASLNLDHEQALRLAEERTTEISPAIVSSVRDGRILPGVDQRGWPFRIRSAFAIASHRYCLDAVIRPTDSSGAGLLIMRKDFSEC